MKLHCIEDIINGQQAFMPSGLVATLSVCPDSKMVTIQYQDGLEVITDTMSYDAFNELIQNGIEMLGDDMPMPLRVMESNMNEAFTYVGNIELELPDEIVKSIAVSGDNEAAVDEALNNKDVQEQLAKFTDDELKQAVEEYGVELDSPDRRTLEQYVVWLAAWNIADSDEDDLVESLLHEDDLDDELNSELKTPFSREEFVDAAVKQLNTAIVDILEYADADDLYQTLADKYGYKYYDDAMVFDVKGRPNLHITAEDVGVDEDTFYNELNSQIEFLAEDLHYEHPDFRICGRSGGYWGFLVGLKDLAVTKAYAEKFVNDMLNNEEFLDWLYSPDADGMAVNDVVWSYIWNYTEYDILCDDVISNPLENLDLSDEFKEKMNNLAETIDSTEKAMDSVDYWKDLFSEEDFAESVERKKLMKNDNIVEELINFSDKDVKLLSDEDIAAQYDNFECTSISVEPSRVHDNWYNFTLELEFPDADHPDFSDYVIENVYYDADADRWGFDNWYPEETSKQLKDLMLKELEKEGYLKPDDEDYDLEAIGLVNGTTDIVVVKNNKTGLYQLNKFDKNESDRIGHMIATKTFETEAEAEEWYLSWSKSRGNNSIAEDLLNEVSDELKQRVIDKRKENVKNAQDKLNRATRLAKQTQPITITITAPMVDVYEDSYEEGELGHVNSWEGSDATKLVRSYEDIRDLLADACDLSVDAEEIYIGSFNINDVNDLQADIFVNNENTTPSEDEIASWKNGELKLYNAQISAIVKFDNPEDREIFINMLKKSEQGIEIQESKKSDSNLSTITEEDLNDLLSMSGERYTDISDLDMPESLAANVPTTEDGEPITLELLYKAISDLSASMTELATAIKQPKVELQPLENPMGQPAPKEEIEIEQEIAEEPVAEESDAEDNAADKERDDKEEDNKDDDKAKKNDKDDSKDLDELDKEIEDELEEDKNNKKEKKNEDLAKAKEEIDKAIEAKKSPEEIDATIDYLTDNDSDEKAADEYKVQKMKEAFRKTLHNNFLERLKWGK